MTVCVTFAEVHKSIHLGPVQIEKKNKFSGVKIKRQATEKFSKKVSGIFSNLGTNVLKKFL